MDGWTDGGLVMGKCVVGLPVKFSVDVVDEMEGVEGTMKNGQQDILVCCIGLKWMV